MKREIIDIKLFKYNPFSDVDVKKLIRQYSEFKAGLHKLDKKKVVSYIILMYDLNSPLRKQYPDYSQRKIEACKLAGFELKNKKLDKEVENFVCGGNEKINNMIVKYIMLFGDPNWLTLIMYYNWFIALSIDKFRGNFDKDDLKSIDFLNSKIQELTTVLFSGKEITEIKRALYKTIEDNRVHSIKPEVIAKKIQEGKNPLNGFNPYDDYMPGESKFLGDS